MSWKTKIRPIIIFGVKYENNNNSNNNNNNNNNNNLKNYMATGVGEALASAYHGNVDAPALHSLG